MSQASALEQYMLELVNAERAKTGAQPLAFNDRLNDSAEAHSRWMIDADVFSHTGVNGSDAGARMRSAGYAFSGSWGWAENIAWVSTRSPAGLQDEVALLHANLMNSPGHRANILNGSYREVGIGVEQGGFQSWDAATATQNFGYSGSSVFLTGVAFDDLDGDRAYDIGEGLANARLTATNTTTGQVFTANTAAAGGYSLALAAGTYATTFQADGLQAQTLTVTIGATNVKLDLIDPTALVGPAPEPTGPVLLTGTARADRITGTDAAERIDGLDGADTLAGVGGADKLLGGAGRDQLDGGAGDDWLQGGIGGDKLTGGIGLDRFVWASAAELGRGTDRDELSDFTQGQDTLDLSGVDTSSLTVGDQAFAFIGSGAFTGVAGQLRFEAVDAARDYTIIQGDLNGDRVTDFEIKLLDRFVQLSATDFLL